MKTRSTSKPIKTKESAESTDSKPIKKSSIVKKKNELVHVDEPVIKNSYEETQFGDYILDEPMEEPFKPTVKKETYRPSYYISAEHWQYLNQVADIDILKKTVSIMTEETIKFEEGLCQYPSIEYCIMISESIVNSERKEQKEQEQKEQEQKEQEQKELQKKEYTREELTAIRNRFLDKL